MKNTKALSVEELDEVRGLANIIRAAISGKEGARKWLKDRDILVPPGVDPEELAKEAVLKKR